MSKTGRIAVVIFIAVAVIAVLALKSQKKEFARSTTTSTEISSSQVQQKNDSGGKVDAPPSPVQVAKPKTESVSKRQPSTRETALKPTTMPQSTKAPVTLEKSPQLRTSASKSKAPVPKRLPKLVDVGAEECVPCKMMMPILEELKHEYKGKMEVEFLNLRENPESAQKLGVRLIPTQIIFDSEGKEVFRHTGFWPKEEIVAKLKELGIVS